MRLSNQLKSYCSRGKHMRSSRGRAVAAQPGWVSESFRLAIVIVVLRVAIITSHKVESQSRSEVSRPLIQVKPALAGASEVIRILYNHAGHLCVVVAMMIKSVHARIPETHPSVVNEQLQ